MKIRSHHESHIVELTNGSRWKIFPGDLDLTLNWKSETELRVEPCDDEISSHELVDEVNGHRVRVIPAHRDWPIHKVKKALKDE